MIDYTSYNGPLSDDVLAGILGIYKEAFEDNPSPDLASRINEKRNLFTVVAYDGDKAVGCKLGNEQNANDFYSWLGGVFFAYRSRGIATVLMQRQHAWLRENNFQWVITETKNKWRAMIILNLKHGFEIRGTYTDDKGEPKIIMAKNLTGG